MFSDMDVFRDEFERFQRDVHILIVGTLSASIRYLDQKARTELESINTALERAKSDDYQQHLVDEHVDVLATNNDQERFLRNMALVALASRLTHSLRTMARSAEVFSPRKKRYGTRDMSEFARLFAEYGERFGIDFQAASQKIAFVDPMREVRNQIVHEGSEANTLKPIDEMNFNLGDAGYLDMTFSDRFPEYVEGTGMGAEVNVTNEQLDQTIVAAIELVRWLSQELREKEIMTAKTLRTT